MINGRSGRRLVHRVSARPRGEQRNVVRGAAAVMNFPPRDARQCKMCPRRPRAGRRTSRAAACKHRARPEKLAEQDASSVSRPGDRLKVELNGRARAHRLTGTHESAVNIGQEPVRNSSAARAAAPGTRERSSRILSSSPRGCDSDRTESGPYCVQRAASSALGVKHETRDVTAHEGLPGDAHAGRHGTPEPGATNQNDGTSHCAA